MTLRSGFVCLAFFSASCVDDPGTEDRTYCNTTEQCMNSAERDAFCLFDGVTGTYCVLPDSTCPSQYRWWERSRPALSEKCVEPDLLTRDGGLR